MVLLFLNIGLSQVKIEQLDFVLGFFPEYDQSNVLVMFQFNIPNSLLPFKAEVKIPKTVLSIFEFQSLDKKNELIEIPITQNGILELNIIETQYYCQFYLDLTVEKSNREFSYILKLNQELNNFHIVIQQPLGAKKFSSTLTDAEIFNDEYNLTYHRELFLGLKKNNELIVNFNYSKESSLHTLQILEKILTDHNHDNDQSQNDISIQSKLTIMSKFKTSKYISFMFGIPLIFLMFSMYNFNKNKVIRTADKNNKYCYKCNKPILLGKRNKFCINCGKKLNVS